MFWLFVRIRKLCGSLYYVPRLAREYPTIAGGFPVDVTDHATEPKVFNSFSFVLLFYSTALECIKELIVRCKYDTLMQLIEKEDCWKLFEEEKTFPDGVVLMARYVNTSGRFSRRLCSLIFSCKTQVKRLT